MSFTHYLYIYRIKISTLNKCTVIQCRKTYWRESRLYQTLWTYSGDLNSKNLNTELISIGNFYLFGIQIKGRRDYRSGMDVIVICYKYLVTFKFIFPKNVDVFGKNVDVFGKIFYLFHLLKSHKRS